MTEIFCARSLGSGPSPPRRMAVLGRYRKSVIGNKPGRVVFLDRDGVLNRDTGYVAHARELRFCHRVLPLLRRYRQEGYRLVVVTNQSGIDRGYYSARQVIRCNRFLLRHLRWQGLPMDGLYYCPSRREGDRYRKPNPGMLLAAARRYRIDLAHSLMIGDRPSDQRAARRAGVGRSILLTRRPGRLQRPRRYRSQRTEAPLQSKGEWTCF